MKMFTFGQKLKKLRETRGFTQAELAEKIGVNPQTIYRYEKIDGVNISSAELSLLAKLFNVSTDYLLGIVCFPSLDSIEFKNECLICRDKERIDKSVEYYWIWCNSDPKKGSPVWGGYTKWVGWEDSAHQLEKRALCVVNAYGVYKSRCEITGPPMVINDRYSKFLFNVCEGHALISVSAYREFYSETKSEYFVGKAFEDKICEKSIEELVAENYMYFQQ